jgi:hypothetical protein
MKPTMYTTRFDYFVSSKKDTHFDDPTEARQVTWKHLTVLQGNRWFPYDASV